MARGYKALTLCGWLINKITLIYDCWVVIGMVLRSSNPKWFGTVKPNKLISI